MTSSPSFLADDSAASIVAESLQLALDIHEDAERLQKAAAAQQEHIQARDAQLEKQAGVITDLQSRLQKAAIASEVELRQSLSILRDRGLIGSDEALVKVAKLCHDEPRQLLELLVKVAMNLQPLAPTPGQSRKLDPDNDITPRLSKAAGAVDEDLLFIQQHGLR